MACGVRLPCADAAANGSNSADPRLRVAEQAEDPADRIVEPIDDPLLERNDRIVRDVNVLGAHGGAALRDVAVPHAVPSLQIRDAVGTVDRVHLERSVVDEKSRPDERIVQPVIPQHVAHVLAQETFDALPEFLDAVNVALIHAPVAVGVLGPPWRERLDLLLHLVVPGDVGDEIADGRKGAHRLDGDRFVERQGVQPCHAHEPRLSVDLRRARSALAGLAVPAAGQVWRLGRLDAVDGVEDDHPLRHVGRVVHVAAVGARAAPDPERGLGHHFISSIICFRPAGIGGMGMWRTCIEPSGARPTCTLRVAHSGSIEGQSSRKCPPRLSRRSSAERAMASLTVSRFLRSSAACQPVWYSRWPLTPTRSARACRSARRARASCISASVRTIPTRSCIMPCRSCCTANGFSPPAPRSNGASANRSTAATWSSSIATAPFVRENSAAYSPARLPNTTMSERELPPSRFAPLMPDAHSPAANRPGTDDICVSASTCTPPMM